MTRLLGLFGLQVKRQILGWSGSWWFIVALAAGQLLAPLIGMAVWMTVFPDSSRVSTYYLALLFTVATTASYENHIFSQSIYRGTLSERLVEPQPVVLAPLAENTAIRVWITMFALPVVALVALATRVSTDLGSLSQAAPLWLGAGMLRFLFTWCLAMSAFWSERVHAITGFGTTLTFLLGGNAVPISFLPPDLTSVLRYLPFYSMVGLPADTSAGIPPTQVFRGALVQLAWLGLMGGLAVLLWRRGLRRYTSAGG
ncbi:ABC-2 family transporter protein [Micromonospora sp. NPDC050397]|uniref:ABC-2 family transporter protein n=1 Tax=Micromonospora sp. NPDC050397 TaxID=3364279 RepID=UPI00384A47E6